MHGYQFDSIIPFIHIDVIKLLKIRLDITIYNRETDQAMVWAYLRGLNDAVLENDDQYINMIFRRRRQQHILCL